MIDICIAAYLNYDLLKIQLSHWDWISGDHRILVCDNTPSLYRLGGWFDPCAYKSHIELYRQEYDGIDGTRHGEALNMLIRKTSTPIVGICDSDFFWLKPDILSDIEELFDRGTKCVGVELWYDDFWIVNQRYPERAGWLAPCVFGMFIDRDLALSDTFAVTPTEGCELKETGWRMRKKIIDERIQCHVYRTHTYDKNTDPKICYFGSPPIGVHLLKGSSMRINETVAAYGQSLEVAQGYLPWSLPCLH